METDVFKERMKRRNAIEGTMSEMTRVHPRISCNSCRVSGGLL